MALVECVPNFSEGRNRNVIKAITDEIESVEGATLLDVDPGKATNRTVVTFAGTPEAVVKAAFQAIKKAKELIDMSGHMGEHPRMGATDVCPLVPISGITIEECVELAHKLAKRVGEELKIPVYFYEYAATSPQRKSLADIRKGEYEGLKDKLKDPNWVPDYGPASFDKKAGATVIGVREFLIAYNVNLNTRDRKLAQKIALNIRESGRAKRDEEGRILRDENGTIIKTKGNFKCVRAVGWYIDEYNMAQVSINLTNYKVTPLYRVFDECCKEAAKLGLRVTGSEVVGLIPKDALLETGRHYLLKQGKTAGVPEKELYDYYFSSDVYISAATQHDWIMGLAEAMACGLPVISSAQPFLVRDGKNGFVVGMNNPLGLAEAVVRIYREKLGRKFGAEGKKLAKEYDWKNIAKVAIGKYEGLVKRNK